MFFIPGGKPGNGEWPWQKKRYLGFGKYRAGIGNDGNSLFMHPLFVKVTPPLNVSIQAQSPAVDRAVPFVKAGDKGIDEQPGASGLLDMGADEVNEFLRPWFWSYKVSLAKTKPVKSHSFYRQWSN